MAFVESLCWCNLSSSTIFWIADVDMVDVDDDLSPLFSYADCITSWCHKPAKK